MISDSDKNSLAERRSAISAFIPTNAGFSVEQKTATGYEWFVFQFWKLLTMKEDSDDDEATFRAMEAKAKLDQKSQLVLGLHGFNGIGDEDEEEEEEEKYIDAAENSFRRAPLRLSSGFVEKLTANEEIKNALDRIKYRVDDVEKYLEPKKMEFNPKPQPGYFVPRKIPTRPRKMLPLLIGIDQKTQEEVRRKPSSEWKVASESRVLTNLKNNPSLAALFMDDKLEKTLKGRQMLTDEQKGKSRVKTIRALPRLFGAPTAKAQMIDAKVSKI